MDVLLSHCQAAFSQNGSLFVVFFIAGLTGGFTHCLAMCGPLVASGSCGGCAGACGKSQRVADATQYSYHLGRLFTYGVLGFLAALLSKQIQSFAFWPVLSAIMLAAAGITFIMSSLPGCKHLAFMPSGKLTFTRGAMLGFMPCGLLYAALMMAATTANPISGMIAMWMFVLGTLPALLIASAGVSILAQKRRAVMQKVGSVLMMFNGLSLLVMAEKLLIRI